MKLAIVTLAIATGLGGIVASYAQEKPKAAAASPPAGVQKEMPVAGSAAAQVAETPGPSSGPAKVGTTAVVKPGMTMQSKAFKQ
jgi:hypothetical protein